MKTSQFVLNGTEKCFGILSLLTDIIYHKNFSILLIQTTVNGTITPRKRRFLCIWSNSTKSHSRHGELSDVAVVPQGLSLPRIPDRHLEADRPFPALPLDHPHHHPPPPVRLHHALHLLICEAIDDAYDETL